MDDDFVTLYRRYKNSIFSYIYYLCGDRDAAEEICQEAFLKVYLNITKFEGRSSFKTWIYRIARNAYIDFINANSKEMPFDEPKQLARDLIAKGTDPEEYALNNEKKLLILKTLSQLTEKYRNLIILRDMQQMSYKEISNLTEQDLNNVKVGIYRARQEFCIIYQRMEGKW